MSSRSRRGNRNRQRCRKRSGHGNWNRHGNRSRRRGRRNFTTLAKRRDRQQTERCGPSPINSEHSKTPSSGTSISHRSRLESKAATALVGRLQTLVKRLEPLPANDTTGHAHFCNGAPGQNPATAVFVPRRSSKRQKAHSAVTQIPPREADKHNAKINGGKKGKG